MQRSRSFLLLAAGFVVSAAARDVYPGKPSSQVNLDGPVDHQIEGRLTYSKLSHDNLNDQSGVVGDPQADATPTNTNSAGLGSVKLSETQGH